MTTMEDQAKELSFENRKIKYEKQPITSVQTCLDRIKGLKKDKSYQMFYRGHAEKGHPLRARLFWKNLDCYEKPLLQKIISQKPSEFSEDKNMFERLIRAQHYGRRIHYIFNKR